MLISTDWLQSHIAKKVTAKVMAEAMEKAGIEVENIHQVPVYDPRLVVAEVLRIDPHPDADKLSVVTVNDGKARQQIVCGAPNLKVGQKLALAQVGTKLPAGQLITETEIRGVKSPGMLCSTEELGLGSERSGVLELSQTYAAGTQLKSLFSAGEIIDIKTAANRPDLNGVVWIAREVSVQLGSKASVDSFQPELKATAAKNFQNQIPELVPRYALAKLSLPPKLPATPELIVKRLVGAGMKPISLVVDITNYVMLETAQPLHAFDTQAIKGKLVIRNAKPGEYLQTLDGAERKLTSADMVIADSSKTVALAGVMGGQNSEISPKTRAILLEAANFNAVVTRRSAQRHGLRTEASARFERGLPLQFVPIGMNQAIELLQKHAGAKVEFVEDQLNAWPWVQHIGVRPGRLSQLAGFKISESQIVKALSQLGFAAEKFDICKEAKKHLGKPYKWGASFKTDGDNAFDCGYFIDYLFSLIGQTVGHSAPQIMTSGKRVELDALCPGDMLFRDGAWKKLKRAQRGGVSHVAMYLGGNQIIHAENYHRIEGEWQELPPREQKVRLDSLVTITKDPQFLGARRLAADPGGYIAVTVPFWRPDVKTSEDVLEEVVKIVGFEAIKPSLPAWQPINTQVDKEEAFRQNLRLLLIGLGLSEIMSSPFASRAELEQLGLKASSALALKNPLSQDQGYLSPSFVSGLLRAVKDNSQRADSFSFFELGATFKPSGRTLRESQVLGAIYQRPRPPYREVKNVLDNLARHLGIEIKLVPTPTRPYLHPGRQATITTGNQLLGQLGELHPELVAKLKLSGQVAYLELNIEVLRSSQRTPTFKALSRYQSASRDLTVWLDRQVTWQEVAKASSGLNPALSVHYLGDYYPEDSATQRALSLRLQIEPTASGLTEASINRYHHQLLSLLKAKFGAEPKL